jgi:hypothetical protein
MTALTLGHRAERQYEVTFRGDASLLCEMIVASPPLMGVLSAGSTAAASSSFSTEKIKTLTNAWYHKFKVTSLE